jgi:hypothetical protein
VSAGGGDPGHWRAWHEDYDDPGSLLSQRLAVVVRRTRAALTAAPRGPVRLVSACAGQGRDVVAALERHPRRSEVHGRLVELDPDNAATAQRAIESAGLTGLEVSVADGGVTDAYVGAVPADVVLLCGIFGNVPDVDVERTVRSASGLCARGAVVVWTRHRRDPDLTPAIRGWFADSGFEEVGFDSPGAGSYAVGTHHLLADPRPLDRGVRLFTFG